MDQALLQVLTHCYENTKSLVLILDLHWEILWSNHPCTGIGNLPKQLDISPNHTENTTHLFQFGGRLHSCKLLCNLQDGFRIAEITPCEGTEPISLRMNADAITASVQSMTNICHVLHSELDAMEMYDQKDLLNLLMGNCYRIYRTAFLQKEIDRLQNNDRRQECFSVRAALQTIQERLFSILRSCMEVKLTLCDEDVFLTGDMDEWIMAVLSAVVLCCKGCEQFQQLTLTLTQQEEMACLHLKSAKIDAPLLRPSCKVEDISAGDCEGERIILSAFCQEHGGRWIFSEQKDTKCCNLYFRPASYNGGSLTLHSPRERQEGRFFNKYELMLSCIHYRNFF